jgi:hypothetical protein
MSTTINIPASGTISLAPQQTTVTAGSDGVALPASSIEVASTGGVQSPGAALIQTQAGPTLVIYTSTDATHLLGCRGGQGTLHTGDVVTHVIVDGPHSIPDSATAWTLAVNRNVGATPIDTLAATPCLWMLFQVSLDQGSTWLDNMGGELQGGKLIPTKGPNAGVEQTVSSISSDLPAGTGRQARAGFAPLQSFTVDGTLTLLP